jgi:hypothetical protein
VDGVGQGYVGIRIGPENGPGVGMCGGGVHEVKEAYTLPTYEVKTSVGCGWCGDVLGRGARGGGGQHAAHVLRCDGCGACGSGSAKDLGKVMAYPGPHSRLPQFRLKLTTPEAFFFLRKV